MPVEERLHRWAPSLRTRSLLVLTAVTLAPLLVASAVSLRNVRAPDVLRRLVEHEAAQLALALADGNDSDARQALVRANERAGGRYHLLDDSGVVRATVGDSHQPNLVERVQAFVFGDDRLPPAPARLRVQDTPELADAWTLAQERGQHTRCAPSPSGQQVLCVAIARASAGRFVLLERAERRSVGALAEERYQLLRLTLFILPGALLLGAWLAWRMIRPIEVLRREVDRRAGMSAPSADLPVTRKDELGALAMAFNQLATRLSDRAQENEAFVADLAHEFKNPVAALRSAADKLAEGPHDEERLQRLSRVFLESSAQLQRVLDAFLELAHAEAGFDAGEREEVDLGEMLRALVASHERASLEPHHGEPSLNLTLGPGDLRAHVVPDRVEAVVRNLMQNAKAFAQSRVHLSVHGESDEVRVVVADDGPGIPEEDRARVFERFFTRRQGAGGTGLGLALVRAVVEAHQGRVWVEQSELGGAAFVVSLPRA